MDDELKFEVKLGAAVKRYATRADGAVDVTRITTSALSASNRSGWLEWLLPVGTSGATGRTKPFAVSAVVVVALAAAILALYVNQPNLNVGLQNPDSTPSPIVTSRPTMLPGTPPAVPTSTLSANGPWTGRVRVDAREMPVLSMNGPRLCIADNAFVWNDSVDAQRGAVDITGTSRGRSAESWSFDLAAKPTPASELDARVTVIEYGLVLDTKGDAAPDYEIGVSNSAGGGSYRVWVTDLGAGTTEEQIGPPYGTPIEFRHPDEQDGGTDTSSMSFWFLPGSAPGDLNWPDRYYAWASYSENGSVVAWDYAPDFGWLESDCEPLPAKGWPDTSENSAGLYSWDGHSCAAGQSCNVGFMHNGYGSGDVEIRIQALPEDAVVDDSREHRTIAGHDAVYRRVDARHEEWTVEIDGRTIAISMIADSGTSEADLTEAHAIIESMRYEPQNSDLGFRLVFELTSEDWDSG